MRQSIETLPNCNGVEDIEGFALLDALTYCLYLYLNPLYHDSLHLCYELFLSAVT